MGNDLNAEYNYDKPSATLLVHLCSWCDPIYCHKEQFTRLNHAKQRVNVMKNIQEDLFLGDTELYVSIVRMRAVVYDTVHIQVKVVELWNLEYVTRPER